MQEVRAQQCRVVQDSLSDGIVWELLLLSRRNGVRKARRRQAVRGGRGLVLSMKICCVCGISYPNESDCVYSVPGRVDL